MPCVYVLASHGQICLSRPCYLEWSVNVLMVVIVVVCGGEGALIGGYSTEGRALMVVVRGGLARGRHLIKGQSSDCGGGGGVGWGVA